MADEQLTRPGSASPAKRDQTKVIGAGILGAVAALFAILNFDDVKVKWIVTTSRTPLIVVIVVCFGLGAAFGALAARRAAARRGGG